MIFKYYHLILISIVFIVQIKMESVEEDYYDDYDYNSKKQLINEKRLNGDDRVQAVRVDDRLVDDRGDDKLIGDRIADNKLASDKLDNKNEHLDDRAYDEDTYFKDELKNDDKLINKYDSINRFQNMKYDNKRNYEVIPYELLDEDYDLNSENRDVNDSLDSKYFKLSNEFKNTKKEVDVTSKDAANEKDISNSNENTKDVQAKNVVKDKLRKSSKSKKNRVKLIKEIKYPKSSTKPKYYYPGRNFVHQRQSSKKKDKKISKIKMKTNRFVNDELATLIPLELYKHQVKSSFLTNNEFTNDGLTSGMQSNGLSRLKEFEMPQILNGELYCDCGFYLKLKNKKIDKLNSKLQKVSNEQKQMKRKLVEMAVKENQLQLICRSQSKANLKYFNRHTGKASYLALSNSTAQSSPISLSNPIDLI